jgi:hypothetical protein
MSVYLYNNYQPLFPPFIANIGLFLHYLPGLWDVISRAISNLLNRGASESPGLHSRKITDASSQAPSSAVSKTPIPSQSEPGPVLAPKTENETLIQKDPNVSERLAAGHLAIKTKKTRIAFQKIVKLNMELGEIVKQTLSNLENTLNDPYFQTDTKTASYFWNLLRNCYILSERIDENKNLETEQIKDFIRSGINKLTSMLSILCEDDYRENYVNLIQELQQVKECLLEIDCQLELLEHPHCYLPPLPAGRVTSYHIPRQQIPLQSNKRNSQQPNNLPRGKLLRQIHASCRKPPLNTPERGRLRQNKNPRLASTSTASLPM